MTAIKQEDLIQSIADAFQYISYYHPLDYIKALGEAYEREESPAAKDAIAQILTNSRMAAEGHRPICQDTGIGMVFIKVGVLVVTVVDDGDTPVVPEPRWNPHAALNNSAATTTGENRVRMEDMNLLVGQ